MSKEGENGPKECERASFTMRKKSDVISPAKWKIMIWDFMMDRQWAQSAKPEMESGLAWWSIKGNIKNNKSWCVEHEMLGGARESWNSLISFSQSRLTYADENEREREKQMSNERHFMKIPLNPRIMNKLPRSLRCTLVVKTKKYTESCFSQSST